MKKIITLTFALSMISLTSFGQSGTFGENNALRWTLANSTLTITGTGAMPDCTNGKYYVAPPWSGHGDFTSVIIGEGITSIGERTFEGKGKLTSVTLPKTITSIGYSAFGKCENLTEVILPKGLKTIGGNAFYQCFALKSITIPEGVGSIGHSAFEHCYGLRSITIKDNVNLGVIIKDNVYTCGLRLFVRSYNDSNNWGMTLTIGKNVTFPFVPGGTSLQTFSGCSNMTEIHVQDPNPPVLNDDIFGQYTHGVVGPTSIYYFTYPAVDKSSCKLYVPTGSSSAYRSAAIWKDFSSIIEENVASTDNITKRSLNISPSPASDFIIISGLTGGGKSLHIYNLSGRLLLSRKSAAETETISVAHLPAGVYIVRTENGQTGKWIKK
jgi:hypothetical protein